MEVLGATAPARALGVSVLVTHSTVAAGHPKTVAWTAPVLLKRLRLLVYVTLLLMFFTHRKPGLTGRGMYELKPECAKEFNLYFYHFSRAEQSKVRGAQCSRKC